jgi:hypothetical protein
MALTLLGGLIAKFDTCPARNMLSASSGGLWTGCVPPTKSLPFAVLWHQGEEPQDSTEDDYWETGKFQFEVYDYDLDRCERIALEIKKAFDVIGRSGGGAQPQLSIDGVSRVELERNSYLVTAYMEEKDGGGRPIFQATIDYTVKVFGKTYGTN